MKTKFSVVGMLALALAFGAISAGCDNGTTSDPPLPPVEIGSLADLQAINNDAANLSKSYKLTADITGVTTPIGKVSESMEPFTGDFDGGGYSIAVNITSGAAFSGGGYSGIYAGLFAGIGAGGSVHDLKVSGTVNITNSGNGIVGAGGVAGGLLPGASISNVESSVAVTVTSSGSGNVMAGGIAGGVQGGTVSNSHATGVISATSTAASGDVDVGGVVGAASSGVINRVYATGSVTATGLDDVRAGGIVGTSSESTISNMYATGSVSATTSGSESVYAGGIAGTGTVSYAYATGAVSATGTGAGNQTGDNKTTVGAGGIVGATSAPVRYTVALNSSVSASDTESISSYNKCSYRITSTSGGGVTTNGAANYGKSDLVPTGGLYGVDEGADRQDGVDVTVTPGSPYTAPNQAWWTGTGFNGADWTSVWEWDTATGLPKLR